MAEGFIPDGAGTWDAWKFIGMARSEAEVFDSIGDAGEVECDGAWRVVSFSVGTE